MNGRKRNKSGRPVKGSLKPIKNSMVEKVYNDTIKHRDIVNLNDIELMREHYKDIVAIYFDHAAKIKGVKVDIYDASIEIIRDMLLKYNNPYISGFVECCIAYYNNGLNHVVDLCMIEAECNAKDRGKAFTQACKNSEKIVKNRINKLLEKMLNGVWSNISVDVKQQYEAMPTAINFVCRYFSDINNGDLPESITKETYANAYICDANISKYYALDSSCDKYLLTKNSVSYSALEQKCATIIICSIF